MEFRMHGQLDSMRSRTGNLEEHSSQQTLNAMQSQLQLLKAQNEALVAKVAGFEAAPKAVQPPEVEFENQKARNEVRAGVNTGSSGAEADVQRRLSIYTLGTTATSGCYEVTGGSNIGLTLSSATACTNRCPSCFFATTITASITLTLSSCSSAKLDASSSYTGMREYVFVNGHASNTLTVTDGTNSYKLGPMQMAKAMCSSSGSDRLYFQSNYGVAGSNVATCPDACDATAPFKVDGATQFSTINNVAAAFATKVATWDTASAGGGYCPRGCDAVTPNYGTGSAFSVAKGMTAAVADFLTSNPPSANVIYNTGATACTSGEQVCMSR